MAATVKKEGIRKRRFPQTSTKHALSTPYNLQWPKLKVNGDHSIIDQVVRTLKPLQFKQLGSRIPTVSVEESEETAARKLEEQKERAKKLELRSTLAIGLNQVTRALEKGTLTLVLVDRSTKPTTLLEHLLVLCATRNTAACALSGMAESAIPMLLGVRRVAAFGFKTSDTPTVFDELVHFIKDSIPPLYVPWLHPRREVSGQSAAQANCTLDAYNEVNSEDEDLPGIEEMRSRRRRRPRRKRIRKSKNNEGELNTQAPAIRHFADETGQFPKKKWIASTTTENPPTKETLTRDELLEVSDSTNSALTFKPVSTMSENEHKVWQRRKRRKRGKKKTGKTQLKAEPTVRLVYLRPCIKSFDSTTKDKRDQAK